MKNKKIIISLIIVFLIMIIAVLGALYFLTDVFKTEQQLFYKYIGKVQIIDYNFVEKFNKVNERVSENNSFSKTNIELNMKKLNLTTGANDTQKIFSIESNAKKNLSSKQAYSDFKIGVNEQELLTLRYLRDDNTYALTADNVLAKYLAVENSNLKELFSKFGVTDTSQIPDSVPTNMEETFKIDKNTLTTLKQTYKNLIYNHISKECFYKVVNEDKTVSIGVSLTQQEFVNLLKLILETSKQDTTFLNLIINKKYTNATVETLQKEIQNVIDEISKNTYSTEKDFIRIQLIKNNKNVLRIGLEINYKEEIQYSEKNLVSL